MSRDEDVEIVYVVLTHTFTARCPYCGDSMKGAEAISAAFAWATRHECAPAQTDDGADPTRGGSGTTAPAATPAAPSSPDTWQTLGFDR